MLRSETQGALLSALTIADHQGATITELAEIMDVDPSTALREVDRLEAAGILVTRRVGRSRVVDLNDESPLVGPLRELVLRALGPIPLLREAVTGVSGVERAFVFGSWAATALGEHGGTVSDIDLLIIGSPDRDEVLDAVLVVEHRLGRPVDVTFRTATEWADTADPLVSTVRSRPMVELV